MKDTSILMLTYNAPMYVKETLETLHRVTNPEDLKKCEIIVWDNNSDQETKELLSSLKRQGLIDKLHFSKENLLFAGGNNEAAKLSDKSTKYYLLLNSDIKIKDKNWLRFLKDELENNNYAGVSYGFCKSPNRCDGYCLLLDRHLYDKYELDTAYQWWWGVTKLEAMILKEGKNLLAFRNHNHILFHYGGKSGDSYKKAKGLYTPMKEIMQWFKNSKGTVKTKNALHRGNILKWLR